MAVQEIKREIKVPDLLSLDDPNAREKFDSANYSIVEKHVTTLILSRLLVFQAFFEALPQITSMSHRRLWLLAQTHPSLFFGSDVFTIIYTALHPRYHPSWSTKIRYDTSSQHYLQELEFKYVVDDTQIPMKELPSAFLSSESDGRTGRPLLTAIIRTFTKVTGGSQIILSGTKFSRETVEREMYTGVLKPYQWQVYF